MGMDMEKLLQQVGAMQQQMQQAQEELANETVEASAGGGNAALGAVAKGSLPFTGFHIWMTLLFGLALVSVGLTARSYAGRNS